ncbi:MAG: TetR/AcrR family transcriptional regulator [Acidobacteria bacterium]|nr:TetR/AcrR family transcriptional regulator [Acidobacteriota bacterium]
MTSRPPHSSARATRPAATAARRVRRPGPPPTTRRPATVGDTSTRHLIFEAAAHEFSTHGFDGASVDAIARAAHVNKAMLYYHFASKIGLYRAIVGDMLRAVEAGVTELAASRDTPTRKIERFIATLAAQKAARPWFPPLMLREMSDGAPHLDAATLAHLRAIFTAFGSILAAGAARGEFRRVHPVLAYVSIMGPMLMNAVRERAAAKHGRLDISLFAPVATDELVSHMQLAARRMLAPLRATPKGRQP